LDSLDFVFINSDFSDYPAILPYDVDYLDFGLAPSQTENISWRLNHVDILKKISVNHKYVTGKFPIDYNEFVTKLKALNIPVDYPF
jgi:hypothetical protein